MMQRSRAAVLALAVALVAGPALAAGLPSWRIAEVDGSNLERWGEAAQEAGRTYRVARAGQGASITVPAWWGEGLRPDEGRVYDVKIVYKDTATQPIVFSSAAGVGSYYNPIEVHRFGGMGDGQWKTAIVPVSWDLVARINEPFVGLTDNTRFVIRADKDLPVESIEITEAADDAQERYNRETREWVARVQAEKRKDAKLGDKQEPVIPETMKEQALVPYARTYLVPILQNAAPQEGEAGAPLKLRMARNEYEPAAFGVYANGRDLQNVIFSVSDLKDAEGNLLRAEVDLRTAEYSAVNSAARRENRPAEYLMWPQRLWPMYPVDIKAGQSHWFWVTIRTQEEQSEPGTYKGRVNIRADGNVQASLPIEVEVLPVTLLTMQEAGLDLGGCSRMVPAQDLQALAQNNHTGMDIWFGGSQPQMDVRDGEIQFDWTYLDDWMKRAKRYGMDHMMWFMGGDPYGFPDTINLERDLYRAGTGGGESARLRREYLDHTNKNPETVMPVVRERYVKFIRDLARHADENDWPTRLIIHPFDEPAKWVQDHKWENPFHEVIGAGRWIKAHFKDAASLIREGAEGRSNIQVGGDMHHATPSMVFLEDVDVFCTNAIHEDSQLSRRVKQHGVDFWQYSGTSDHTPPHQPRFTFGFYFAAFDSTGSLIWAYDMMERFDTSEGGGQWGYGWYTPFGTVPAPFMYGVREGFDDRRWIKTYEAEVGEAAAEPVLQPIDVAAIEQRTGRGRDTVNDFFAEMQRLENLDQWRNSIIEAMLKAQQDE